MPLIALLLAALVACADPAETGTGPDTATDTEGGGPDTAPDTADDTALPPFAPTYWTWLLYIGVRGGEATAVVNGGETVPPHLEVWLVDDAWVDDPASGERCEARHTIEAAPADLAPDQVLAWDLVLTPWDTDCARLDDGVDPFAFAFAGERAWSVAALPLDPILEAALDDAGVRTDHVIGADTWLDGASVAEDAGQQTHYASAVEVDDEMVVNPGDVLDTEALLAGTDAWWVIHHAYLFPL